MSFIGATSYKFLPRRLFNALRILKYPELLLPFESFTYNQDGLVTDHNVDFMRDDRFARAYKKGDETGSWSGAKIHWRAHVACWAAERGKALEGDFVECGVNRGGLSRTVMEYIGFASMQSRKFYLLDTYEGLAEKYISEEEKKLGRQAGGYEECYEAVKSTFAPFANAIVIKGTVPDILSQVKSEKIAYLSIDMNCAEPEIAAANYFWNKLTSGAAMILDDYGWKEHIVQKRAFDEFAKSKNASILSLPTGQGLILKL
jgi:O-methyltransferase